MDELKKERNLALERCARTTIMERGPGAQLTAYRQRQERARTHKEVQELAEVPAISSALAL